MNKKVGATLTIIILTVIDQVTKYFASENLYPDKVADFIPGVVQFRYAENTGMAFSLLENSRWFFIVVTAVACIAMLVYLYFFKCSSYWLYWSIVVVVSGGIGNMIDRVLYGFVIDFIEPTFVDFAIFNFADCLVTVGAVSLISYLVFDLVKDMKKEKGKNNE